jgi:hypothetical protein
LHGNISLDVPNTFDAVLANTAIALRAIPSVWQGRSKTVPK